MPVGHHLLAVGILRGHEQHDDVLEHPLHARIVGGRERVQQVVGHLAAADLVPVDVGADQHDDLAFACDAVGLRRRRQARVRQLLLHRLVAGQVRDRVGRRHDCAEGRAGRRSSGRGPGRPRDRDSRSTVWKYSTIRDQPAMRRSAPIRKPKNCSGDGMADSPRTAVPAASIATTPSSANRRNRRMPGRVGLWGRGIGTHQTKKYSLPYTLPGSCASSI